MYINAFFHTIYMYRGWQDERGRYYPADRDTGKSPGRMGERGGSLERGRDRSRNSYDKDREYARDYDRRRDVDRYFMFIYTMRYHILVSVIPSIINDLLVNFI